jgi:SynChlorMet cassette radical SAM/SPASM protein ScmE
MDLAITAQCNLRCKYCSHFTSGGDVGQDVPTSEWLEFFEELQRNAVTDVCLQGGEPFCREDLKELIQGIVRNRMRFSLLTNGTLITDDMAAFIASTGRCNSVQVSIDGSHDTTHDAFRGEGNFRRAVEGLRTLMRHNIQSTVRVTVHRKNVSDLKEVAKFLLEDIGLPSFSTNSASHLGLCRKNAEQVQLTPQERSLAMKALLELTETYNGRINATAGPLAEARVWTEMERARAERQAQITGRGFLTACGGPMEKLGVRADGVIVVCVQMPDLALGRMNRDDLREIWTDHPILYQFRTRGGLSLRDFDFCSGCEYLDYCTGNCPALAHTLLNNAQHPSPDACLRRFLEAGGTLPNG